MFITYLSPDIIVYRRTPSYNIIQHRASPDITGQHHASTKIIVYHRHRRAHLLYTTGHHRTLPDTIVARTFNVNNHISLHFVVHHHISSYIIVHGQKIRTLEEHNVFLF